MINLSNTEIAFQDKSNREIRRALFLFKVIASPFLVKVGAALTRFALKIGLPITWILKPTIFNHFCGGVSISDCNETIVRLGRSNIKTILDYSAEGKETDTDFDYTRDQIIETVIKASKDENVPYAVFKPTGVGRFGLLEKVQAKNDLSELEKLELERVKVRFALICDTGARLNVPVMIDAEETWIQDIVDEIVEELIFEHNKTKPLVYTTLQMYRHDRLEYLKDLVGRAKEKGVKAAVKLVRGAYMEKERERAKELGYPSPIYADKQGTDSAYDQAVKFCIENVNDVAVCIGTHNEKSSLLGAEEMVKLGVKPQNPNISFSQLLGMSDNISYNLAAAGFNVTKYVPYGPVKTVVPYLIRRAEENTSVAGQTSRELALIRTELKRRNQKQSDK
jgi:proline dehydrogenase